MCAGIAAILAGCGSEIVQPSPDAPSVDLALEMTVDDSLPGVGDTIAFSVTVRNNGPLAATSVQVGDTLPAGLVYVSHSTTMGSYVTSGLWPVGTLPVRASATLTVRARVAQGTEQLRLVNTAAILGSAFNDSVLTNNITSAAVRVQGATSAPPSPTPPPSPPSVGTVFSSSWSTATGNGDAALRDGGRWTNLYCQQAPNVASVVSGASVGWTRTPNVLRLQQLGPSQCGTLEKTELLPASTSHYGRMYFRNDEVATQHNHVATYNPGVGAPIQVALWNRSGSSNGVAIFLRTYFQASGQTSVYPTNFWAIGTPNRQGMDRLPNGVWYRYEWHMEYVTARTYRIWPRIYDMAGTLLYDATRFYQNDYPQSGTQSLASWYAAGNTFGLTDPQLARRFGLGNEGPANSASTGGYWYHADVAISTSGWIGR
jgi:uncharacterized repeat protein (TIGR01451 family)